MKKKIFEGRIYVFWKGKQLKKSKEKKNVVADLVNQIVFNLGDIHEAGCEFWKIIF